MRAVILDIISQELALFIRRDISSINGVDVVPVGRSQFQGVRRAGVYGWTQFRQGFSIRLFIGVASSTLSGTSNSAAFTGGSYQA